MESWNTESFVTDNHSFKKLNYHKLVKNYSILDNSEKIFEYNRNELSEQFRNPGVPHIVIYMKFIPTISSLRYPKGILNFIHNNKFAKSDHQYNYGDGTLSSNSTLIPSIKWAFEFHNKKNSDSHIYVGIF